MLLKERLRQLFSSYDPDVQRVVNEVLDLEQRYISYDRPRLKDQIDEIVAAVADKKPAKARQAKLSE